MRLTVPEQIITLEPVADEQWMGRITIDGQQYRIEAFTLDTELSDILYAFTGAGEPMRAHTLPDGTEAYLAVTPLDR